MSTDQVMPDGAWEFDDDVAKVFGDMLSRSIPDYDTMRSQVIAWTDELTPPEGRVADIGCSNGLLIESLLERRPDIQVTGTDVSEPMLEQAALRFEDDVRVSILKSDLRTDPVPVADTIVASLTIQFTPLEYRQRILRLIRDSCLSFVFVEKVLGSTDEMDAAMVKLYYDMKREHGYSDEQIERKRLSLEGVLVPVTAAWNEEFLHKAGFPHVDCIWRLGNFAAWVAW